jgi:hypothetical protein
MIVDNTLKLNDATDVRASDPDFSSAFDLTISPELGIGHEVYAVIVVNTYTAGDSTGTTFNLIQSSSPTFASGNNIMANRYISSTKLEERDDGANKQPIVLKFQIDMEDITVGGTGKRYLGIRYDHDAGAPTAMTVTAYLTTDFQSDPKHGFFTTGSTIL